MQWRRVSASVVALLFVLAGCSSDRGDDGLELGLDDGADVEVEPDDGDDESSAEDGGSASAEADPLYPPLPPLEPDPASEIPVEDQRFFLELYAGGYEVSQRAFATAEADEEALAEYFDGDALDEIIATIAAWEAEGHVSRSPDGEVAWLEVVDIGNGEFRVRECSIAGPRTGLYEAATGEPVELIDAPSAVVIETTYSLVGGDGTPRYRGVAIQSVSDADRCHV